MAERERSDVIERFRYIAETDSRVLASFLGGSLAAGTADAYSDTDIYFVVDPSKYDRFHSDVASLLNTFGPWSTSTNTTISDSTWFCSCSRTT